MIASPPPDQNCSSTKVTTMQNDCFPGRKVVSNALPVRPGGFHAGECGLAEPTDTFVAEGLREFESIRNIHLGSLPGFAATPVPNSGTPAADDTQSLPTGTGLDSLHNKELTNAVAKAADLIYHTSSATSSTSLPGVNPYSKSGPHSLEPNAGTSAYDSSDALFDDAFSLDEFVLVTGGKVHEPYQEKQWGDRPNPYQSYGVSAVNSIPRLSTKCEDAMDIDQSNVIQTIINDSQKQCTQLQPFVNMEQHHLQRPACREIQGGEFSSLVYNEASTVKRVVSQKHTAPSADAKVRDGSESNDSGDSGLGYSILGAGGVPKGHQTNGSSKAVMVSPECVATTSHGSGVVENERCPSNGSEDDLLLSEFACLHDDEMVNNEEKASSKKTQYNKKWGVKVLKAWCSERYFSEDFENFPPEKLNDMLCSFWSDVRQSNGTHYGRNSMFNLRAMINKYLKSKPDRVNVDIVTDERFRTSNEILEKQLKHLKSIGKTITHKQPISLEDLKLMYESNILGTSTPMALLRKVWFEITLYFCHKGSEPQEKLTRRSFQTYRDENSQVLFLSRSPELKTGHEKDDVRLYETGDELCPIRSFQLYMQKLHPDQGRLFQQPRRKSSPDSPTWYGKAPIGEKALQLMMANISVEASLSARYTNHCVRTTSLEQFHDAKKQCVGEGPSRPLPDRSAPNAPSTSSQGQRGNPPAYALPRLSYVSHPQAYYGKPQVPAYGQTSVDDQSQVYQYHHIGGYGNAAHRFQSTEPLIPLSCPTRPVPPQAGARGPSPCYKRSPMQSCRQIAYPPLPDSAKPVAQYCGSQKRVRLENCRVFLSRSAPGTIDWPGSDYSQYVAGQNVAGCSPEAPPGSMNPYPQGRVLLQSMVTTNGGQDKSYGNENFAVLPHI